MHLLRINAVRGYDEFIVVFFLFAEWPVVNSPGDNCDAHAVFGCGPGASCVLGSDGSGICRCLPGYFLVTKLGFCKEKISANNHTADDVTPHSSGATSSSSNKICKHF